MWEVSRGGRLLEIGLGIFQKGLGVGGLTSCSDTVGRD